MKKLWELNYSESFEFEGKTYYTYSNVQRVSNTEIIRLCIDTQTGLMVELNANIEVKTENK